MSLSKRLDRLTPRCRRYPVSEEEIARRTAEWEHSETRARFKRVIGEYFNQLLEPLSPAERAPQIAEWLAWYERYTPRRRA